MNIGIIGLGYVGLPLAAALSKKHTVYGMDINANRIARLKQFKDDTQELTSDQLKKVVGVGLHLTTEIESLADCSVFIITVPTPVTKNNIPDLSPVIKATEAVAGIVKEGDIIVYESTVYPGVTNDFCINILEKKSKLNENR